MANRLQYPWVDSKGDRGIVKDQSPCETVHENKTEEFDACVLCAATQGCSLE